MAKEKKGRKFGRHADRSPSAKAYKAGNRLVRNKARTLKRHTRRMAKKAIHRIQWEARTQRRHLTQPEADRIIQLRQVVSQNHTG